MKLLAVFAAALLFWQLPNVATYCALYATAGPQIAQTQALVGSYRARLDARIEDESK